MNKLVSIAGAIAIACVLLAGCNVDSGLSVSVATDIQSALAIGCPIWNLVRSTNPKLNAHQKSAVATLALACPPNPAPTSAVVAVTDLVSAYTILQPLLRN